LIVIIPKYFRVIIGLGYLGVSRVIRVISPPTALLAIFFRMEKAAKTLGNHGLYMGKPFKRALMGSEGPPGDYLLFPWVLF